MDRFAAEGIPLSVAVLDMDWHLVDIDPRHGSGWTGYTWNRELFPDPPAFLAALHERGLATTLNVHPAEGVHAHEERYAAIARRMGVDPDSELPVDFDPADPAFLRGLPRGAAPSARGRGRRLLVARLAAGRGHPRRRARSALAAQPLPLPGQPGDDGTAAADVLPLRRGRQPPLPDRLLRRHRDHLGVAGLPAVLHRDREQHRLRLVEPRRRRPLLRLQGRRAGRPLDPVRRVLADHPPALERQPVQHPRAVALRRAGAADHDQLPAAAPPAGALPAHDEPPRAPRRRAARAADVLRPPGRRRRLPGAATSTCFGDRLLVAPITTPADRATGLGSVRAWLPPGRWTDVFTGLVYRGGTTILLHRDLDTIPVLAPAGAILPLAAARSRASPTRTRWSCGCTRARTGNSRWPRSGTTSAGRSPGSRCAGDELRIHPVDGERGSVPATRRYDVVLCGFAGVTAVEVDGTEQPTDPGPVRRQRERVSAAVGARRPRAPCSGSSATPPRPGTGTSAERVVRPARRRADRAGDQGAGAPGRDGHDPARAVPALAALDLPRPLFTAVVELLLAECG